MDYQGSPPPREFPLLDLTALTSLLVQQSHVDDEALKDVPVILPFPLHIHTPTPSDSLSLFECSPSISSTSTLSACASELSHLDLSKSPSWQHPQVPRFKPSHRRCISLPDTLKSIMSIPHLERIPDVTPIVTRRVDDVMKDIFALDYPSHSEDSLQLLEASPFPSLENLPLPLLDTTPLQFYDGCLVSPTTPLESTSPFPQQQTPSLLNIPSTSRQRISHRRCLSLPQERLLPFIDSTPSCISTTPSHSTYGPPSCISTTPSHSTSPMPLQETPSLEWCTDDYILAQGKIFTCLYPNCYRTFNRKGNLKTHLKTHNPIRDKAFECGTCGKKYFRVYELYRHEQVHSSQIVSYACLCCQVKFTRKDALRKHIYSRSASCLQWYNENQEKALLDNITEQ